MSVLTGLDVSKWQGEMDWARAAVAGASFAIIRGASIRANDGVMYTDFQFERNLDLAPQHLVLAGVYGFFRPNYDPFMQADYLLDLMKDIPFPTFVVADVETSGGLPQDTIAKRVGQYVAHLQANRQDQRVVIYTRGTVWNPYVGNPDWVNVELNPLWVARYSNILAGPWSDGLYRPLPWFDWLWWQWSADGNFRGEEFGAESYHIDLNRYRGTIEQLRAYIGQTDQPDPGPGEPAPPGAIKRVEVTALGLNVRWGPSAANPKARTPLARGEQVYVYQIEGSWGRVDPILCHWVHLGYTKDV